LSALLAGVLQVDVPSKVARQAADAAELRLLVNAAYIAGLPQCQDQLTKMVIMDSTGEQGVLDAFKIFQGAVTVAHV
jgi:hypothetical protein